MNLFIFEMKVPIPRSKSFMTVPQNYSIAELFEELQVNSQIILISAVQKSATHHHSRKRK